MSYPRRDIAHFCDSVTVLAASSTKVLDAWGDRLEVTIVNDGANVVYLMLATQVPSPAAANTPVAAVGKGIRLAAGASWTSNSYRGAIYARASTADTSVTVSEI